MPEVVTEAMHYESLEVVEEVRTLVKDALQSLGGMNERLNTVQADMRDMKTAVATNTQNIAQIKTDIHETREAVAPLKQTGLKPDEISRVIQRSYENHKVRDQRIGAVRGAFWTSATGGFLLMLWQGFQHLIRDGN